MTEYTNDQVLYECGESRFDDGPGEAPNECPTCGAPIAAVKADYTTENEVQTDR